MSMAYDQASLLGSLSQYTHIWMTPSLPKCLVDTRVILHACHISFENLLCEHVDMHIFSHSRISNCCYLAFIFLWLIGYTRMPKYLPLAIYAFSSQILFMLHHKICASTCRTLCVRSTRSSVSLRADFQNLPSAISV